MAGFCANEYGCLGTLTVDGFSLNTPAWDMYGFQPLWSEVALRGDEVILPTAPGVRSYPSRLDQIDFEMTLYVNGEVDANGVEYPDYWMGLYTNLRTLRANAFGPVTTGRGTRAAVLTLPDGLTTMTADIKFDTLRQVNEIETPSFAVFRTTLTIPAGEFVEVP